MITFNEMLLSNKANMMNFKKAPAVVSDAPMPKPEGANLAFKATPVSKTASKAITSIALAAAALGTHSCVQVPELERRDITINNTVNIDFAVLNELIAELKAEREQDRQQDSVYHAQTMEILNLIYTADDESRQAIVALYQAYLNNENEMTWAQFRDLLLAMKERLDNIDKNVAHMDSVLTLHSASFNEFVNKYSNDQVNLNLRFDNFEKNDSAKIAEAIAIKDIINNMNIDVAGIKLNGDSIYALLKDNNSQLMDSLAVWLNNNNGAGNSDVTNNSLQAMLNDFFNNLSLDLNNVADKSVANIDSIISNKWNEYKQMKNDEIANYSAKYDSLMAKLDGMFGRLGDIDQNILNVGANLAGKVDTVNLNITNFTDVYNAGNDSIAALIKEFKNASTERQDTIIAKIEAFENSTKASLDSLKLSAKDANTYLAEMRDSIAPALDLLRELRDNGNNNYQNFLQVLAERDSVNHTNFFNTFNNTMAALGLDSIAQTVKDIKTLETTINDKMDGVHAILDFITNLNYDNLDADVIAKLQEMFDFIKTHQFCNCNCQGNNNQNNHEGILDNLDNLFAQNNVADRVNTYALNFLYNNLNNTKVVKFSDYA